MPDLSNAASRPAVPLCTARSRVVAALAPEGENADVLPALTPSSGFFMPAWAERGGAERTGAGSQKRARRRQVLLLPQLLLLPQMSTGAAAAPAPCAERRSDTGPLLLLRVVQGD